MLWVIFFFICGVVLIMLEFVLPGGVCGGIGTLLVIISTIMGCITYPDAALFIVVAELFGAIFCVFFGILVVGRTGMANFLRLNAAQNQEEGWVDTPSELSLVGKTGTVLSALRPAGIILGGDQRINAVSDSAFIDKDAAIKVVEVQGNRIMVEPVEMEEQS